jgi:hypothetical protein
LPAKWIGFIVFLWTVFAIAGSISVGEVLISDNLTSVNATQDNPVQGVMYYGETITNTDAGFVSMVSAVPGFFTSILRILWLDFPLFHEGPWVIIRWIVLATISATVIYGVIVTFTNVLQRSV